MGSYNFQNYSFSNSLKTLVDPFQQLLKKPAATSTPTALFSPAPSPVKPATPALNYTPIPPNMSTPTGPKYAAPSPVIPKTSPTGGSYTVQAGDTLSAIAAKSGMSMSQLLAANPQFASNPNLIRPGQSVALGGTGAPQGPVSAPAGPAKPAIPQITPAAGPQGPATAPGTPPGPQESAPGGASAPATPQVSPEALKALDLAEKAYQDSQKLSPDELSTQEDIDKLVESTKTAYRNTSNQAIPLEFITGQLSAIERRATGLAEPLERKLARLQATRQASLESSKFALDRADKAVAGERSRAETARAEAESTRRFEATQGESKRQFDLNYRLSEAKFAEDKRQFGLDYANKQREIAVKEAEAAKTGESGTYQEQKTGLILSTIQGLMPRISNKTTGIGSYAASIRGTEAYNFKSELDTLKSNIAFGELQAMRAASKTGGALGAVSEKELTLLESALGALDQGQSPENFKKNLQAIYDSLARWNTAVASGGSAATSSSGGGSSFTSPSGATYKLPY